MRYFKYILLIDKLRNNKKIYIPIFMLSHYFLSFLPNILLIFSFPSTSFKMCISKSSIYQGHQFWFVSLITKQRPVYFVMSYLGLKWFGKYFIKSFKCNFSERMNGFSKKLSKERKWKIYSRTNLLKGNTDPMSKVIFDEWSSLFSPSVNTWLQIEQD